MVKIERYLGELAAAHRLMHHGGPCRTLHGHNWSLTVWVEAPDPDPEHGIAIDFLDFDKLRDEVFADLDHGLWLNRRDPLLQLLDGSGIPMNLTITDGDPTAETMGALILKRLRARFPEALRYGVRLTEATGYAAEITDGNN